MSKAPTVAGLRNKIDRIDRQLVLFMNQRAKLAHRIGQIKDSVGHEAYDPAREEEVLARAITFNKRAAVEMTERLDDAVAPLGVEPGAVRVRTFHALGREILRDAVKAFCDLEADGPAAFLVRP